MLYFCLIIYLFSIVNLFILLCFKCVIFLVILFLRKYGKWWCVIIKNIKIKNEKFMNIRGRMIFFNVKIDRRKMYLCVKVSKY